MDMERENIGITTQNVLIDLAAAKAEIRCLQDENDWLRDMVKLALTQPTQSVDKE